VPVFRDPNLAPVEEVNPSQECELDPALAERVADLSSRIHTLDFYEVLGVGRDADKDTIKRAFYALAPVFHPDRYYGKKIGDFRRAMEYVFGRITLAFDTLSSPARRRRYDRLLAGVEVEAEPIALKQGHRKLASQPAPPDEGDAEAQFLVETGNAALARGDHTKAARAYRMALEIHDDPDARAALARCEELDKVQ
jgi:DnaJ-class molecular chaperone